MKTNRLVNIWATIIHLSDKYFSTAHKKNNPSLDLLISERLQLNAHNKQIWMINPFWQTPGTTEVLLHESYQTIRDAQESYLILFTPGFADIVNGIPLQLVRRQLEQLHKRGRIFNKRVITTSLGIPPECPLSVSKKINRLNKIVEQVAKNYHGLTTNLQNILYEPWTSRGSRPGDLAETAKYIVEVIINCHSSTDMWKKLHEK